MSTDLPSPNWYADPDGGDQWRYWDGQQWTDLRKPVGIPIGDGQARGSRLWAVAYALIGTVALVSGAVSDPASPGQIALGVVLLGCAAAEWWPGNRWSGPLVQGLVAAGLVVLAAVRTSWLVALGLAAILVVGYAVTRMQDRLPRRWGQALDLAALGGGIAYAFATGIF